MSIKKLLVAAALTFSVSTTAFASLGALCVNNQGMPIQSYICCRSTPDTWYLGNECAGGQEAQFDCSPNSKVINTGASITTDCRNRHGSRVIYPLNFASH